MAFRSLWGFDPASVSVPVRLWHGSKERVVPIPHGRWLAAAVPYAQAAFSDEDGHLTVAAYRIGEVHDWLHNITDQPTRSMPSPRMCVRRSQPALAREWQPLAPRSSVRTSPGSGESVPLASGGSRSAVAHVRASAARGELLPFGTGNARPPFRHAQRAGCFLGRAATASTAAARFAIGPMEQSGCVTAGPDRTPRSPATGRLRFATPWLGWRGL
jgi:hypothetical protein